MSLGWVVGVLEFLTDALSAGAGDMLWPKRLPGPDWEPPHRAPRLSDEKRQALANAMLLTLGWDGREAPQERSALVDELCAAAGGVERAEVAPLLGVARERVYAMKNLGASRTLLAEACAAMTTFDEQVHLLRCVATVAWADPDAGKRQRDVVDVFAFELGIDKERTDRLVAAARERVQRYL